MRNSFSRQLLCALAVTSAFAGPAFAQDSSEDERPFDGVYVGGSFGYTVQGNDNGEGVTFDRDLNGSYGDTVVNAAGVNVFSPGPCNGRALGNNIGAGCAGDKDGIEYYGRIGADKQVGSFVFGVVGEFGRSEASDSVTVFSTTPAAYQFTRSLDYNGAIRGRAGFAADKTLFYGTGGVTYGKIDSSFTSTNTLNAYEERGGDWSWGWQAGGGIEQKVARNLSFGLEYLYSRYTEDDYRVRASQGGAAANHPFVLGNPAGTDLRRTDQRFETHGIRATAALRF